MGLKHDTTGVVVVAREGEKLRVVGHSLFVPPEGETLNLEATVEATIIDLSRRYQVMKVVADPYQAIGTLQRLRDRGIATEEFPQTPDRLVFASENLYRLITERGLEVYHDDDIRGHLLNSVAREVGDRGSRIVKKSAGQKVDLAISLMMACAAWQNYVVPGIFVSERAATTERKDESEQERFERLMNDDRVWQNW